MWMQITYFNILVNVSHFSIVFPIRILNLFLWSFTSVIGLPCFFIWTVILVLLFVSLYVCMPLVFFKMLRSALWTNFTWFYRLYNLSGGVKLHFSKHNSITKQLKSKRWVWREKALCWLYAEQQKRYLDIYDFIKISCETCTQWWSLFL